MKSPQHDGPPPGLMTVAEVCAALGIERANFYRSKLVEALPRWLAGQTLLFRRGDVGKLREWLAFRAARWAEGDNAYRAMNPEWVRDLDHAMDVVEGWEESRESDGIADELLE